MVGASLRMILRNFERRPLKSVLSVIAVSFAMAILVLGRNAFDGIDFLIDFQFRTVQREDVSVAFVGPMPARVRYDLARLPSVMEVESYRAVPVRIRHEHRTEQSVLLGLPAGGRLRRVVDRRRRAIALPVAGVVITDTLADMMGVSTGDTLVVETLEGARPTIRLPIAGTVDELIGTTLYMDLTALQAVFGGERVVSGAYLTVDDLAEGELYRRLKTIPVISGVSLRESAIRNFQDTIAENTAISTVMLIVFSSVIAAGILYNGARIALSERSHELATLRVLGFTRAEVTTLLLGEQVIVVCLAIPLGSALGWAMSWWIMQSFASELFRMPVVLTLKSYLYSLTVVVVAAAGSGWLVRRRIRHLDLIGVLKTRE